MKAFGDETIGKRIEAQGALTQYEGLVYKAVIERGADEPAKHGWQLTGSAWGATAEHGGARDIEAALDTLHQRGLIERRENKDGIPEVRAILDDGEWALLYHGWRNQRIEEMESGLYDANAPGLEWTDRLAAFNEVNRLWLRVVAHDEAVAALGLPSVAF